jgi:hypothetical protein
MQASGDSGNGRRGDSGPCAEDYERIDITQWHASGDPVVSEFRRQHGDLQFTKDCMQCNGRGKSDNPHGLGVIPCDGCGGRGRIHEAEDVKLKDIRFAQVQVRNVMNYLADSFDQTGNPWLDEQNIHDGQTYERWQAIFQAKTAGVRCNHLYYVGGEAEGEGISEKGFSLILMRLPVQYQRAIESAIHTLADTGHARFLARRNAKYYARAFGRLTFLMPGVLDDLKTLKEKLKRERENA